MTQDQKSMCYKIALKLDAIYRLFPNAQPDANFYQIAVDFMNRLPDMFAAAVEGYRTPSKEDIANGYYHAQCPRCGWHGSSRLLEGGGQIADTGDYGDTYCPVCGFVDPGERGVEDIKEVNPVITNFVIIPEFIHDAFCHSCRCTGAGCDHRLREPEYRCDQLKDFEKFLTDSNK